MRAIVQDAYGDTQTLRLAGIERPQPADAEVLIRVRAAGVDPGVRHLMTGEPYLVRIASGLSVPKQRVPGLDVAGVVESVGRSVTGLAEGDEVFGTADGSFAEFAITTPARLSRKPASTTFEQAAAVPVSGCAALHAMRDRGLVRPGQRVLITGAGGGVGSFAVQLGRAIGAEVTGVCSGRKADFVRALGASAVIDYQLQEIAGVYDVIIDIAGNRPLSALQPHLAERGRLVIVGGEGGGRWLGGLQRPLWASVRSVAGAQRMGTFYSTERAEDLDVLRAFIDAGQVAPVVDRVYPLQEAVRAIDYLTQQRPPGKVVLSIA